MKTILEFIANKKPTAPKYKYHPKTKEELIEAIKTELESGNEDLNCIDTSSIIDMSKLFHHYDGINIYKYKNINISNWDVSNVTDMSSMFGYCGKLDCDLSNWDVSNVTDMSSMFYYCPTFNADLSGWDVSNVTDMSSIFYYCKKFNCDLSKWDVSNVTDMSYMFHNCENFNCDLSGWNLSKVKNTQNVRAMFIDCPISKIYGETPKIENIKFVKK